MKSVLSLFCLFFFCSLLFAQSDQLGQEIPLETKIDQVTVFFQAAQIVRKAEQHLPKGKSFLVVKKLSPYLLPSSLVVKGKGDFVIQGVRLRRNLLEEEKRSEQLKVFEKMLASLEDSLALLEGMQEVLTEERDFLRANRQISGENTSYSLEDLQGVRNYYVDRMSAIQQQMFLLKKQLAQKREEKVRYKEQIRALGARDRGEGWYEVLIELSAEREVLGRIELSYLTEHAGWFPSYDLRVDKLSEPVRLTYQANFQQNTKEDWREVQLVFSNADPQVSGQLPLLNPYWLTYGLGSASSVIQPTGRYGVLEGYVFDANTGEPLIGATLYFEGTNVGTVTDIEGHYDLIVPSGGPHVLSVSYVGYSSHQVGNISQSGGWLDVRLEEVAALNEAVVVTGARMSGIKSKKKSRAFGDSDKLGEAPIVSARTNTTSVELALTQPYTLLSGSGVVKLNLTEVQMPADYKHESSPKLREEAYLVAYLPDWRQHHLLDGEVNLYFENTFVGRSLLDLNQAGDTLQVSLGQDQGVEVKRELVRDFSRQSVLGSKRKVQRRYKITLRNNKEEAIQLSVYDQIPLSSDKSIEVIALEQSGGEIDMETGIVKWELNLPPGKEVELIHAYEVRYPKQKYLVVD